MNRSKGANRRYSKNEIPVARLLLFGGLVALGFAGGHHVVPGLVLEVAMLGSLVYVLAGFPTLRQLLRASPRNYRVTALVFVTLLVVGQTVKSSTNTFPIVGWTMYGAVHRHDPIVYEYTAIRRSGAAERFTPERAIPTLANSRIENRLKRQIALVEEARGNVARDRLFRQHEATLRALAALENRYAGDDPIMEMEVTRGTIPMYGYEGEESIVKETLWTIAITPQE